MARQRAAHPERLHMTRGSRLMLVAAMALAALVGFALVRTFRSPALEQAAAAEPEAVAEPEAATARDPVPPQATMPGAPDSGWAAATQAASPAPPPTVAAVNDGIGASVSVAPAAEPRTRAYTDADLRTFVARRGVAAATNDRAYLLALRQRRVNDLRERLADARSGDERAKLQGWLDGALADLERARR